MSKPRCPKCGSKNIQGNGKIGKVCGIPMGIAAGGLFGLGAGAKGLTAGAAIGTAICPGLGTAIGTGIGLAVMGTLWGYKIGDKFDQDSRKGCYCLDCGYKFHKI